MINDDIKHARAGSTAAVSAGICDEIPYSNNVITYISNYIIWDDMCAMNMIQVMMMSGDCKCTVSVDTYTHPPLPLNIRLIIDTIWHRRIILI